MSWLDYIKAQVLLIAGVEKSPHSNRWNFVSGASAVYNAATRAWDITIAGGGGSGDVVGPASSTDDRLALFDGATGKLLKQSSLLVGRLFLRDGSLSLTGDLDAGTNQLTNVGAPSASTDAATKGYVDTAVAAAGGGGMGFRFTYSTTTTDSDPGAGTLRGNNATLSSVTTLYVDLAEYGGTDVTAWLDSLDDYAGSIKGIVRLSSQSDPTKWVEYTMTAWTTATGYRKLTVVYKDGPGGLLTTAGDTFFAFDYATSGQVLRDGTLGLTASWDVGNQAIDDVKSISYDGEIDNGNSSTADTIDWTTGALQKSTLTGNCTYTFTAPPAFTAVQLRHVQDATGGRVPTWPGSVLWAGGVEPNWDLSPSAENIAGGYYDGTNYRLGALDDGAMRIVTEGTTTRTCVLSDGGSMIECTHASGCAVTIPPNASVPIRIGKTILFTQSGAAQVTLVAGAGVTLETSETLKTAKLYAVIGATKLATNRWRVFGERELA